MSSDARCVFVSEWFDQAASIIRAYHFIYYLNDQTIEMFDLKNRKLFLRRTQYPQITFADLYLGNIFSVFGRQIKLIDYADVFTKSKFEQAKEKTFAMIKPDAYLNMGKIISRIEQESLIVSQIKLSRFEPQQAAAFYAEHQGKPFFNALIEFICSDYVVGLELIGPGAIKKWREIIGPTNSLTAKEQAPQSIRALYGTDGQKNAVHGSDSNQSAQRELNFFFSDQSPLKQTAYFTNCTLCLIKPHIVSARKSGLIIDYILAQGFEISAIQTLYLDSEVSFEFFSVYKDVLPEYKSISDNFQTGPCIALEIRQEHAVEQFRQICGPHDPEIAKHICKDSIRAQFGIDRVKNAVHCTDLPEDGVLEVDYFFNVLQIKAAIQNQK